MPCGAAGRRDLTARAAWRCPRRELVWARDLRHVAGLGERVCVPAPARTRARARTWEPRGAAGRTLVSGGRRVEGVAGRGAALPEKSLQVHPSRRPRALRRPAYAGLVWHWADLTLMKEGTNSHETAQDFANAFLHLDARGECDVEIAMRLQSANDAVYEIDSQLERIYAKRAQQMEMAHAHRESSNTDIDTWLEQSASNDNVMPSPKGSAILSVGSEDDAQSVQARTAGPMDAAPTHKEDSNGKLEQDPFEALEILKSGIASETCD